MKRRTKTKFTQIHVSIPVRTLEDFDETLAFAESRSKKITNLISNYLEEDQTHVGMMETKNVIAAAMGRFEPQSHQWLTLKVLYDSLL